MTVYFCIYCLIGIASLSYVNGVTTKKASNIMICVVAFISLATMFSLRHPTMGHDLRYGLSNGYLSSFEIISMMSLKDCLSATVLNYERGYILFNKLISLISEEPQVFLAVSSIIPMFLISYTIGNLSLSPGQSFIIYMGIPAFHMMYSGLRQALAIGICFFALNFIADKKIVKFVITVILATLFHKTAIVFLVAYPIYHFKLTKNQRWVSVGLIPIVYIARYPLFKMLSKLFKENATADNNGAFTLFLVFTLMYIYCIVFGDDDEKSLGLMNVFYMACICQAFGGVYNTAMRVGYYFMMALIVLLPLTLKNMPSKFNSAFFRIAINVCFAAFGLYRIYASTWSMAYPYHFYWELI